MSSFILSSCMLLLATVCVAQQTPPIESEIVRGDTGAAIDQYMTRLSAFGLSGALLVEKNGEVILHKGYGMADRSTGLPVNTSMIFNIGSLGKQFTAAAILKLEMEGKLSTSDSLGRFFPNTPADKAGITLHQLLTHTSGLPYLWSGPMFAPITAEALVAEILAQPLEARPGERYAYSNPGYSLLGRVIETASGLSYQEYLRRNLFEPAGMMRTGFEGESDRWDGALVVHSYTDSRDEGALRSFPRSEKAIGAGTVISTVGDLYKWEKALRGDAILSADARRKLFGRHVTVQGTNSYGYGWNVGTTPRKTTVIVHGGDIGGYNAELRRYPDEQMTVIFTSNSRVNGIGYRQAVMNNIIFLMTGSSYPAPPAVTAGDTNELRQYAGTYEIRSGEKVAAWIEGGRLMLGAEGQEAISLLAGSDPNDPEMRKVQSDLNARVENVIDGILAGDMSAFRENLDPSLPAEDAVAEEQQRWVSYRERFGPFAGRQILGTALLSPAVARTFVRLSFEKGEVIDMYGWFGGKIATIEGEITRPMATPFLPESENTVASFDIFSGRTIRAIFDVQKNGAVAGMLLRTAGGEVAAKRTGA